MVSSWRVLYAAPGTEREDPAEAASFDVTLRRKDVASDEPLLAQLGRSIVVEVRCRDRCP